MHDNETSNIVINVPFLSPAESSQAAKSGGCFPAAASVQISSGAQIPISQLRVGDRVLALDTNTGKPVYSEVLLFLDRDPERHRAFLRIRTASGRQLALTPSHLVLVADSTGMTRGVFASRVRPGDRLLVEDPKALSESPRLLPDEVVAVDGSSLEEGVYAPLTAAGTVMVDGVAASCYAAVNSQSLAHWSFAPLRIAANARSAASRLWSLAWHVEPRTYSNSTVTSGVHWYAKFLYGVAIRVLPSSWMYSE
ncbi:hypothetical protein J437_LFUL005058 [Ladona fulva]|uniref:Hint domain-containing protein n=1 Tax=Ladona fulva TaxID=123851 RepID=A0A8K0P9I7_LADFU|nr:hypothetical protein J437_LFUL005058 [Ladona fulva]